MINSCDDYSVTVSVEYSDEPEKDESLGRYVVKAWNSNYEDDLLFQTPAMVLGKDLSSDDDTILVKSNAEMDAFFERMKAEHLASAVLKKDQWFPGKNISTEVLPDLWKENVKKGSVSFMKGGDPDEPFVVYRPDGEAYDGIIPAGSPIILLLRLEGLSISRSKLGSVYTVVQAMDIGSKGGGEEEEKKKRKKIDTLTILV